MAYREATRRLSFHRHPQSVFDSSLINARYETKKLTDTTAGDNNDIKLTLGEMCAGMYVDPNVAVQDQVMLYI